MGSMPGRLACVLGSKMASTAECLTVAAAGSASMGWVIDSGQGARLKRPCLLAIQRIALRLTASLAV